LAHLVLLRCSLALASIDETALHQGRSGHLADASVKITGRHYAPWVKARQEQLEEGVKKMWAR
jgi:hypothetical protein